MSGELGDPSFGKEFRKRSLYGCGPGYRAFNGWAFSSAIAQGARLIWPRGAFAFLQLAMCWRNCLQTVAQILRRGEIWRLDLDVQSRHVFWEDYAVILYSVNRCSTSTCRELHAPTLGKWVL